jgi:hypothetical protein
MQNLPKSVSGAVESSGFSDFTKCSVCYAVVSFCDYLLPKPRTITTTLSTSH